MIELILLVYLGILLNADSLFYILCFVSFLLKFIKFAIYCYVKYKREE